MSNNGRPDRGQTAALAEILNPKWVLRHRGSTPDFIRRYRAWAGKAAASKLAGLRKAAPHLLEFISDERTLYTALKHMEAEGSHAPGPDQLRYEDIALIGDWKWCRATRDEIRDGEYVPGAEKLQKIPKGPGRGFRELVVQSVQERVIHRAVVEVLQPLLDPLFDRRSFGYRPKMGPLRALATAEHLYRECGLGVWVSVDVRNAFPNVPVPRLLDVVRKYIPDDDLIDFLEVVTRPDTTPGLRQGSPLSPLLLNLYLHHLLDRTWRRLHPDAPLLRFADDILILCRTPKQAQVAYTNLDALLRPAGFTLKESRQDAVRLVKAGQEVSWMGFGIGVTADGLRYTVTEDAWDGLAEKFAAAHGKPHSPLAALASLAAWVGDKAPCFPFTDTAKAYGRMAQLAAAQGFEEIPEKHEVAGVWQPAYARWCGLRDKVAASVAAN